MLADAAELELTSFWFDARETALEFYKKFEFQTEGERFFKGDVAYFRMSKQL
jgi:predicted GNAT family N-acyltransferase